jgi:hypothetical protein
LSAVKQIAGKPAQAEMGAENESFHLLTAATKKHHPETLLFLN